MPPKQVHDASAELLRLALPLMSRYGIPVSPRNYAVFYEYLSGSNGKLKRAFDGLVERAEVIDEDVVDQLYRTFVTAFDEERFDKARIALRSIVAELGETMISADGEVSRYASSLASHSARLSTPLDADEIRALVEALATETRSVRDTSADLHARLACARNEADALRDELEKAKEEAITDGLTGLANRKALDHALDALHETGRLDGQHCLLMCDIDHFKLVNDAHGHLIGDKVIRFVGKTIKDCVKGKDLVARFGGEEFAVVLPDTPMPGALSVAENIRAAIEAGRLVRADTRKSIGNVTISIGVASFRAGDTAADLIGRADAALYVAKNAGRNRVETEAYPALATGTGG